MLYFDQEAELKQWFTALKKAKSDLLDIFEVKRETLMGLAEDLQEKKGYFSSMFSGLQLVFSGCCNNIDRKTHEVQCEEVGARMPIIFDSI